MNPEENLSCPYCGNNMETCAEFREISSYVIKDDSFTYYSNHMSCEDSTFYRCACGYQEKAI